MDTATAYCSVAVLAPAVVVERVEEAGNRHSERLLPMVDDALRAARLELADLDAIVFGAGPGSFTGLRIACSVAQGLAWASDKPVIPVGNLEALALAAVRAASLGTGRLLVAVDARMNEAYWAAWAWDGARLAELRPAALAAIDSLADLAAELDADLIAGDAWAPAARDGARPRFVDARASAATLAEIGTWRFAAGAVVAPADAAPLYVRNRVARTVAERRALAEAS